ncbi:MAG: DUF86 domain-containing protein [Candidatus Omnitrophota bacterium]|nr:MAG: DUF86 domain-containing protein [Candidatus Omnitrophota bacterium]RKY43505.1 MAG: DUF86 domain-containing protein [Candidatus Omnitrophota bacterium]
MKDYRLYLKDILSAMEAIEKFTQGMNFKDFRENDMVYSAVIRKFEIIGEAAKNLPEEIKQKYPEIPWKSMAGMRDRLIHFLFWSKIRTCLGNNKKRNSQD